MNKLEITFRIRQIYKILIFLQKLKVDLYSLSVLYTILDNNETCAYLWKKGKKKMNILWMDIYIYLLYVTALETRSHISHRRKKQQKLYKLCNMFIGE